MIIYSQYIACDALSLLVLVFCVSTSITNATLVSSFAGEDNNNPLRRADEYVMTSALVDGIKRSNVCGDGYRIEGALLKSYPYSKRQTYLPYEDCYMTFKARQIDNQMRIRILSLDLNDIHNGVNCLDSLRFYKSVYLTKQEKLNTVECGQLTEKEAFDVISPTGIVTAHFMTDGGNVSGLGFKVVLTSFRTPDKTHPCDSNNEEFLCQSGECISSLLICDGVPHCSDGSDELPDRSCTSKFLNSGNLDANNRASTSKRQHWRGILIAAFLLIILAVFILFMAYLICRRCAPPSVPLTNHSRKTYATMLNSSKTATTTHVVVPNDRIRKSLDDDYNLL
ncbi:unnamed protein product [Rotaria socialis]|uniref:CUB domain-containing protein n=2 Tax=Rotaria socialis TaxID=392032 RepID=A0A817U942_9BILA|nr:unnamed protein product [Rotaria socialis]CAF3328800.1 unnamed protein product [Rotaria socialis]CAF3363574.1 unnamed protein product [Rotaria socialis]CAF4306570.1 unnamed protein product [Rotaria socialis]CAF4381579.1 unnamed protein product [Rotaria socialis]